MIKLIGAAFILIATTFVGFDKARHLSLRPLQLRSFRQALQALESEIMFGHIPLREAAVRLSKQLPAPVSLFFIHFAARLQEAEMTAKKAWDLSLKSIGGQLTLKENEIEILSQFGETLGKHDRYQQQKQILLTMSHLERAEEDALATQGKYEKMAKSLGFLAGLLFIILLM
ncbi:stage III sporulation protein SpoIIIAB [Bacillus testis]|uniref:stage III sporulation protein SpoIIIAB n=1 Tax=Bacillus testis TaxID=1622072 RepID=UPI00067F68B4|nr:stage III sporulation protein SpoIIIAB [Bacillus testis]